MWSGSINYLFQEALWKERVKVRHKEKNGELQSPIKPLSGDLRSIPSALLGLHSHLVNGVIYINDTERCSLYYSL